MGTSKLSPDERLLRKRLAAKLRQQRCRARKKKMAALKAEERSQPSVVIAADHQAMSPPRNTTAFCPRTPQPWSMMYQSKREFSRLPQHCPAVITPSMENGPSPGRAPLGRPPRLLSNRPLSSKPTMPPFKVTPPRSSSQGALCQIEKTAIDAMLSLQDSAKPAGVTQHKEHSTPFIPPLASQTGNPCGFTARNAPRSKENIPYKFHKYRGDVLLRHQPTVPGFYLTVRHV